MILNIIVNKDNHNIKVELNDYVLKASDKLALREDPSKWFNKNFDKIIKTTEPQFREIDTQSFKWTVTLRIIWKATVALAIQNQDYPLALEITETILERIWPEI